MPERTYQIWNPGNNYYDTVLANLIFGMRYPEGTTRREKVNGEWTDVPIDPLYLGPNQRNQARSQASLEESEALRGQLGSKRKLGKNERMPEGSYALADYPGLGSAVDWARTGNTPVGSMGIGQWLAEFRDPNKERQGRRQRQMWAEMQSRLLGGRY